MRKRSISFILLLGLILGGCVSWKNQPVSPVSTAAPTKTPVPTPTETPAEPIELVVYSQLSSFWGEQQGWFAKELLDRFHVKLSIRPDIYDEEEKPEQADIIVFGSAGETYKTAAEKGLLLDWEANNLLAEHGSYILEHMEKALEHNRGLTPELGKVFGFGHNVATSTDDIEEPMYIWDIRWDLYKQLGYPEVKNLDDLAALLEQMKEIYPVDEAGEETYALSLWTDWDTGMVMYVKAMASAYYGYDELGLGLYDSETGRFYGALEEEGPYLELLRFFNTLYRKGLLDPDSVSQTYENVNAKLQTGGYFFSIFNYAGSLGYNTTEHLAENKFMASLLPEEARPLTYGMSVYGGNRVWTIGADTEYPELCMEIINWLCTPEGKMVSTYGPQGVIWDYDAEGNTYFTEFGKHCYYEEGWTELPGEYAGSTYWDGFPQINNTTWSNNAVNPDSNGEVYHSYYWKSNLPEASCEAEQDWRAYTGALSSFEYIKGKQYTVIPATTYKEAEKNKQLEDSWKKVADCIIQGSWNAIYADSDQAFEEILSEMRSQAVAYGYEECRKWCEQEAEKRYALEEAVRK